MAGLDPIVNVLVSTRRGFDTPLRRGVVEAQRKCVEVARTHCLTQVEFDFDVVVASAYSKASEATIVAWTAVCLKEGGVLVLNSQCEEWTGQSLRPRAMGCSQKGRDALQM